jgi:hypothetical protein
VIRRDLLRGAAAIVVLPVSCGPSMTSLETSGGLRVRARRVRPGDPAWPSAASWNRLNRDVGGRLILVESPLAPCQATPGSPACAEVVRRLTNPYYLGDQPGLTQTSGWLDGFQPHKLPSRRDESPASRARPLPCSPHAQHRLRTGQSWQCRVGLAYDFGRAVESGWLPVVCHPGGLGRSKRCDQGDKAVETLGTKSDRRSVSAPRRL